MGKNVNFTTHPDLLSRIRKCVILYSIKLFVSVMETGCVPLSHEMNVRVLFRGLSLSLFKVMYEKFSVSRRGLVQTDLECR